jgi:hypothetical protein
VVVVKVMKHYVRILITNVLKSSLLPLGEGLGMRDEVPTDQRDFPPSTKNKFPIY